MCSIVLKPLFLQGPEFAVTNTKGYQMPALSISKYLFVIAHHSFGNFPFFTGNFNNILYAKGEFIWRGNANIPFVDFFFVSVMSLLVKYNRVKLPNQ